MPQGVLTCTSCWWLLYCVSLPLPSHWTLNWACLAVWAYTGILWQWRYTLSSSFSTSSSPKMPFSPLPPLSLSGFSLAAATGYNLFQVCEVWGFTLLMLRIQKPVHLPGCFSLHIFPGWPMCLMLEVQAVVLLLCFISLLQLWTCCNAVYDMWTVGCTIYAVCQSYMMPTSLPLCLLVLLNW